MSIHPIEVGDISTKDEEHLRQTIKEVFDSSPGLTTLGGSPVLCLTLQDVNALVDRFLKELEKKNTLPSEQPKKLIQWKEEYGMDRCLILGETPLGNIELELTHEGTYLTKFLKRNLVEPILFPRLADAKKLAEGMYKEALNPCIDWSSEPKSIWMGAKYTGVTPYGIIELGHLPAHGISFLVPNMNSKLSVVIPSQFKSVEGAKACALSIYEIFLGIKV